MVSTCPKHEHCSPVSASRAESCGVFPAPLDATSPASVLAAGEWRKGSQCVSLPKENMQKPNCRHRTYPKNWFFSYNFIFTFKIWGPIILRHCSSHVCPRLVTSIFLSPAPSMSRCLDSACSFCIYIRHISYTLYHHAVGSNKRAFTHPSKQAQNQRPQLPLRFLQHFIKYLSSVHMTLAFGDQPGNSCILARGPPRLGSIFLLKKSRRGWSPKEQASNSWDHASWAPLPFLCTSLLLAIHGFTPISFPRTNSELFGRHHTSRCN